MDTAPPTSDSPTRLDKTVGPLACFGVAAILRLGVLKLQGGVCDFNQGYLYEGYARYLAVLRLLAPTLAYASVVHALIGSTVAPFTFLIARQLRLSERVAWTAGLGAAVLPYYLSVICLQPQVALTIALSALSVLSFVVWRNRSYALRYGVFYALVWSYFSYCRPNAPILLAWTFAIYVAEQCLRHGPGQQRIRWTNVLVVLGIIVFCFNAMAMENDGVYHEYRPFRPVFGYNLYVGNNEHVRADLERTDIDALESAAIMRHSVPTLDNYDSKMDERLGDAAKQFMRSHPAETLHNSVVKAFQYWGFRLRKTEPMNSNKNLLYVVPYVFYLTFALLGIFSLVSDRRYFALCVAVGIVVVYWAPHAVFFSTIRFRMTTEYLLLVLAGEGVWRVARSNPLERRPDVARASALAEPL